MYLSNKMKLPKLKKIFVQNATSDLQGISFDDDSDEDADWKRKDLNEVEVSCVKAFLWFNYIKTLFMRDKPSTDGYSTVVDGMGWVQISRGEL